MTRLDHTRELDQDAVAGRLDDPALVFGYFRVDQLAAERPQARQGSGLVWPISRLCPATSLARMAASLRSTRSAVTVPPFQNLPCADVFGRSIRNA